MLQTGVAYIKLLYKTSWLFFDCLTRRLRWIQFTRLKRRYAFTSRHGVTPKKAWICISTATRTSYLAKRKIALQLTIPCENRSKII